MIHFLMLCALIVGGVPAQASQVADASPENVAAPNLATPSSGVPIDTTSLPPDSPPADRSESAQAVESGSSSADAPDNSAERQVLRRRAASSPKVTSSVQTPWYRSSLVALGAVLGLILLVSYAARRYVPTVRAMSGGALKVTQRIPLSSKQSLALVQLGQRLVLVGVTPDRISTLSVVDDPEECARMRAASAGTSRTEAGDFEDALSRESGKFARAPLEAPVDSSETPKHLQETKGHLEGVLKRLRQVHQA
ncbi:MAG: FliO/MopB family protein [bacterium]|nr:FliO/MopB family protein [bacterium]